MLSTSLRTYHFGEQNRIEKILSLTKVSCSERFLQKHLFLFSDLHRSKNEQMLCQDRFVFS